VLPCKLHKLYASKQKTFLHFIQIFDNIVNIMHTLLAETKSIFSFHSNFYSIVVCTLFCSIMACIFYSIVVCTQTRYRNFLYFPA